MPAHVNAFSHVREPSPVDHQHVVRLNRDTEATSSRSCCTIPAPTV